MPTSTLAPARWLAALLALAVLAWQGGNALAGRFVHPFLIADLIISCWLIAVAIRPSTAGLASAFGAMLGVFLSAVTGRMLAGTLDPGTIAAALGIVPCILGIALSARRFPATSP